LLGYPAEEGIGIDLAVLIPVVVLAALMAVLAGRLVRKAHKRGVVGPSDYLVGRRVTIEHASEGRPSARVDGTLWRVIPVDDSMLLRDDHVVEVVRRDNLNLVVGPLEESVSTADDTASPSPVEDRDVE
jgi:membrane protein implicated in regulation of membrane protease activity